MNEEKVMALVAHDEQKLRMMEWVRHNRKKLKKYELIGTHGTADWVNRLIDLEVEDVAPDLGVEEKPLDLEIEDMAHGPKGGDILIAREIIVGNVDILIFFIDPTSAHAHEHDIQSLRRAALYSNIPFASNRASADRLICS